MAVVLFGLIPRVREFAIALRFIKKPSVLEGSLSLKGYLDIWYLIIINRFN